jgi:hypothetical protein
MTYQPYSPSKPLVVGIHRLLPLQAGHLLVLDCLGSPFVRADVRREPTPVDVSTAVWVCSRDWRCAASRIDRFWSRWAIARRSLFIRPMLPDWLNVVRGYLEGATHPHDPRTFVRSGRATLLPTMAVLRRRARVLLELGEDAFLSSPIATVLQDCKAAMDLRALLGMEPGVGAFGVACLAAKGLSPSVLARLEGAPRG